jgi:hypothetical protein
MMNVLSRTCLVYCATHRGAKTCMKMKCVVALVALSVILYKLQSGAVVNDHSNRGCTFCQIWTEIKTKSKSKYIGNNGSVYSTYHQTQHTNWTEIGNCETCDCDSESRKGFGCLGNRLASASRLNMCLGTANQMNNLQRPSLNDG